MAFFTELEQKFHNSYRNTEDSQISKAILKKKSGAGGISLHDFRLYYITSIYITVSRSL